MAFLGMRGTGDYSVPDQRPKNYRDTILMLYPNGTAPLTAMLAKLPLVLHESMEAGKALGGRIGEETARRLKAEGKI